MPMVLHYVKEHFHSADRMLRSPIGRRHLACDFDEKLLFCIETRPQARSLLPQTPSIALQSAASVLCITPSGFNRIGFMHVIQGLTPLPVVLSPLWGSSVGRLTLRGDAGGWGRRDLACGQWDGGLCTSQIVFGFVSPLWGCSVGRLTLRGDAGGWGRRHLACGQWDVSRNSCFVVFWQDERPQTPQNSFFCP